MKIGNLPGTVGHLCPGWMYHARRMRSSMLNRERTIDVMFAARPLENSLTPSRLLVSQSRVAVLSVVETPVAKGWTAQVFLTVREMMSWRTAQDNAPD